MEVARSYLLSFTPSLFVGNSYSFVVYPVVPMSSSYVLDYWLFSQYNAKELLLTQKARRVIRKKNVEEFKGLEKATVFRNAFKPVSFEKGITQFYSNAPARYSLSLSFKDSYPFETIKFADTHNIAVIESLDSMKPVRLGEIERLTDSVIKQAAFMGSVDLLLNTWKNPMGSDFVKAFTDVNAVRITFAEQQQKSVLGEHLRTISKFEIEQQKSVLGEHLRTISEIEIEKYLTVDSIIPEAEVQEYITVDNVMLAEMQELVGSTLFKYMAGEIQELDSTIHLIKEKAVEVDKLVQSSREDVVRNVEFLSELITLTEADKIFFVSGEKGFLESMVRLSKVEGVKPTLDTAQVINYLQGNVDKIHKVAFIGHFSSNEIMPGVLNATSGTIRDSQAVTLGDASLERLTIDSSMNESIKAHVGILGGALTLTFTNTDSFRATEVIVDKVEGKFYLFRGNGLSIDDEEKALILNTNGVNILISDFADLGLKHGKLYVDEEEADLGLKYGKLYVDEEVSDLGLKHGKLFIDEEVSDLNIKHGKLYVDEEVSELGLKHGKLFIDGDLADLGFHLGKLFEDVELTVLDVKDGVGSYTFDKFVLVPKAGVPTFEGSQSVIDDFIADQYGSAPEEASVEEHIYIGQQEEKIDEATVKERIYEARQAEELDKAIVPERIFEGVIGNLVDAVMSKKSRIKEAVYTIISPFRKKKKRMRIDEPGMLTGPETPPPQPVEQKKIWLIQGKSQSWQLWPRRKTR